MSEFLTPARVFFLISTQQKTLSFGAGRRSAVGEFVFMVINENFVYNVYVSEGMGMCDLKPFSIMLTGCVL